MKSRRDLLKTVGAGMLLKLIPVGAYAADLVKFVDVRLWPADEYTRVTLEHAGAIKYKHFLIENPWRMVIDLLDLRLDSTLKELTSRLHPDDPYVQQIRVAQYDANTVRLVFDLKAEVKPEIFTIDPIAEYKNRFVVDFYPKKSVDPLLSLLDKSEDPAMREDEISRALRLAESETKGTDKSDKPEKPAVDKSSKTEVAKAQPNAPVEKKPSIEMKRMVTVAIDPGHGGEDPGAVGKGGTYEKNVVLAISKRLKAEIDKIPGMRAMLTRNGDFFVPLNTRVQKARSVNADLFVSVHADAFIRPTAGGSSVYVLSERGASSTAAKWIANKENASDLIGGVNIKGTDSQLAKVLLDLSTTAQINDSLKLGDAVLGNLGKVNRLHKPKVEQAGFAVLKAPDIPSILIETAFISNPEEEKKLANPAHQQELAEAIAQGIAKYFAKNPPVARTPLT
ncbi:N-acetylmuramoyl-L-alanine amidase [Limnobacter thiooxidans]|uniref:N-acetylmuramoyl-L-alanine amidase AmiC n=1 Tax=Limnobacter thiooxidans TaxID=131080 RepID=A0AA86IXV5_9BURK|nr:N-acetylmuramoyl-L-alanine amidase [Limnobacter sp.]MCZ8016817.1 N-acetylmuramoyl-L-alanine amidase [Limnobacter sp.]RZS38303.1 N-acetylmuramoyl-L-alanine amidase [Limnobacter thiooxidans]BET25249.1 N-acetylmuramoyl-L-alanine amidase [Limnobacter thiooxidans]